MVRDDQRALWLYAKCGIITIADAEFERWWEHPDSTVKSRLLDIFDGAQPALMSFRPGVSKTPDGRLGFVNDSILEMIDPGRLKGNGTPPAVHVERIVGDRKVYLPEENLRLPPLIRDIEIDYTALSLSIPEKVRFRYMLTGHDANWQEPAERRQAFYSDLSPGKYQFRVMACNSDGVWNEAGAAWNFSVAAAYYQTNWFRTLCAAAIAFGMCVLYQRRVRQIAAGINARLNERMAERTRLAGELHDTLLQTIQASKMIADTALLGTPDETRMRGALERLSGWLDRAMQEGRAALNAMRIPATQQNDLAEALERACEDCVVGVSIECALSVEGKVKAMHPIVHNEVYRIGYEAIRNACIHSMGSHVEVELTYAHDLILRVRDNGKGIDPDVALKGKRVIWACRGCGIGRGEWRASCV